MIHAMQKAPEIAERAEKVVSRPPTTFPLLEHFIELSAALTGFNRAELLSTGMAETYLGQMIITLDDSIVGALIGHWEKIADYTPYLRDEYINVTIMNSATLGPVAQNLIMLWYLGQWVQLPREWRDVHGANTNDVDRIVSAEAYRESLVWATFNGHPQGAKAPGYASWAVEPRKLEHS